MAQRTSVTPSSLNSTIELAPGAWVLIVNELALEREKTLCVTSSRLQKSILAPGLIVISFTLNSRFFCSTRWDMDTSCAIAMVTDARSRMRRRRWGTFIRKNFGYLQ